MQFVDSLDEQQGQRIIDRDALLSQCQLWQWQKKIYQNTLGNNWGAPYAPTSNMLQARAYAQHIQQAIQDCVAQPTWQDGDPFYVVELGAGHGLLTYLIMQQLEKLSIDTPVHHVLVDRLPDMLTHWQKVPRLKEAMASGRLDSAMGNVRQFDRLILNQKQEPLKNVLQRHPSVIIMHYLLDSLPSDTYYTDDQQQHHEIRYTISSHKSNLDARKHPLSIDGIRLSVTRNPIPPQPYPDRHTNETLQHCLAQQEAGQYLHFPVASIELLNQLANIKQPCWIHIQDLPNVYTESPNPFTTKHKKAFYQGIDPNCLLASVQGTAFANMISTKLMGSLLWLGSCNKTMEEMPNAYQGIHACFPADLITPYHTIINQKAHEDNPIGLLEDYHDDPHLILVILVNNRYYLKHRPSIHRALLAKLPDDLSFHPEKDKSCAVVARSYRTLNEPVKALAHYLQISPSFREGPDVIELGLWCYKSNQHMQAYRMLKHVHKKQRFVIRWRDLLCSLRLQLFRIRRAMVLMILPVALLLYLNGVGYH